MRSKIGAAVSKAVATVKAELWDGDSQPSSPQIGPAAATAAAAPAPRWEDDRWNSGEVENLHCKLSHVKEGLETALARVSYLEQTIYDKETSLGVEPDDRLMDAHTLERGKRRDEVLAERAKELWGEEGNEGRVIEAVKIKVKTKEGAEDDEETEEAGEGEKGHYVEGVLHERNNWESGSVQQQLRWRKTRRGTRAGAAVKRKTSTINARDGGGERGRDRAVVGEEAGERRGQVEAMCDRAGPASPLVLLKKLYPLLVTWACVGVIVWRLAQRQGVACSAIE